MEDTAIKIENVSKTFKLPLEKHSSLKSIFVSIFRRHKGYKLQKALDDISFEIKKGEFFGIVGRNGSGKSTLLKLIASIYQPTGGKVQVNGRLVPFIELGVGFNPELTGRENVFLNGALLGFSRKEMQAMYHDIVAFAELDEFMDQKLKNYSSGMEVRLAFSLAIRARADILLVDEVLAVGDADFQRKCFEYFKTLKRNKKTVVFVSHDMDAVREYCDCAVLVDDGQIVFSGTADGAAAEYIRLFNYPEGSRPTGGKRKVATKRWGNNQAKILKVTAPQVLGPNDEELIIKIDAQIKKNLTDPVCGFVIKNSAGEPLLGSNSKIKGHKAGAVKDGQKITYNWTVPNIFAEGQFFVDIALQLSDAVTVCDWWEEAAGFVVRSAEGHIPYSINPRIRLNVES